jgi:Bifunctional DNA primase/polymerase, N-terminal
MSDRLADVVAMLTRGLALFDLPRGERRPTPGWQQRCTSSLQQVTAWVHAGDNLGVGCRASNVAVIDLDQHPGEANGFTTFAKLCEDHSQSWPTTLTTITPNGRHLFFRVPTARIVLSVSGPHGPLGGGIDIRGPGRQTGGYVVAAGSTVPAGEYHILHDQPIANLPVWLADTISEPERTSDGRSDPRHGGRP